MNPVISLIDKAIKKCGSSAKVAKLLGTSNPALVDMRKGRREVSPETAALLANLAGTDPRQAVIDAVIIRNLQREKGPVLLEILGEARATGGAAQWDFSTKEQQKNVTEKQNRKPSVSKQNVDCANKSVTVSLTCATGCHRQSVGSTARRFFKVLGAVLRSDYSTNLQEPWSSTPVGLLNEPSRTLEQYSGRTTL